MNVMSVMNVMNVTSVTGLIKVKLGNLPRKSRRSRGVHGELVLRERSVNSVCSVVRQIPGRFVPIRVIRG